MKNLTLLAVDDDDLILQSLRIGLPQHWRLVAANSANEIPERTNFSAAFVDMHLTPNQDRAEGLSIIQSLKEQHPHLQIVAMSGDLDRELMEKCLRAGATRYIAKPLNLDEVLLTLEKIEALILLQEANFRQVGHKITWIGRSEPSEKIRKQIAQFRGEKGPILIEGESGSGKEVVTHLLHQQEESRPLIIVNVAAIPKNLFESEIFGHTRGAFTGADQNKMGLAEAADGGDLFLDEIEALAPAHQAKLLRFLESGEIRRIGSKDNIRVNTRVIAATNKNLEQMVRDGKFREDLMWRLNTQKIVLPPLRDRKSDIPDLSRYFLSLEKNRRKELDTDALEILQDYNWPGNVRELRRVCEQLALTAPLPVIRRLDVLHIISPSAESSPLESVNFNDGLEKIVQSYEARVILQALKKYDDVDEVSRIFQMSRSNLYKKIKDYNIDWRSS